ncbi:uncharacterized protein [Porites lutea]|uniref:uncharacterized protein n=1 Tax=Porites lutea TaxID=51062 RepID=UPI003CC6656B
MVLKAACLKFIQEFKEEAGFNPIEKCATIASACNLFWRRDLIPEDTIVIEPLNGWCGANVNQSTAALEWLCFEDFKLGGNKLRHVHNGGEQKVITQGEALFVDGYDETTKTVYEFHACFYHGCVKCFPNQRYRKHNCHPDRTISEIYESTCKKTQKLRQAGYTVIEKWEHDFEIEKKTNPTLMEFLKTFQLSEPLNPRDSFFGGRTNGVRLHCVAVAGEEIRYVEINSLYPYVKKTKTYPEELEKQWLTRTAVCTHTAEERCITGTWCTPELQKAVDLGYKILKIYEVWHFSENQRKEGLFADYVNKWLKNKTEASSWPKNGTTEAAKSEYINAYYDREGVQLEPAKVAKNGGRKQVAKLMLNSFWGKFGEKPNKTQTFTVTSPAELYAIIEDAGNNIHDIRICTDDIVEIDVSKAVEEVIPSNKTNIFIPSFTTSWARLELYKYLELLKEQVLYFDTDSIIYLWRNGLPEVETGPFLGQMRDETAGVPIQEFATGGPKNHTYMLQNGETECKIRGFTQDEQGRALLNFDSMKSHILAAIKNPGNAPQPIVVPVSVNMNTNRTTKKVCLAPKVKNYRLVFEKRVIQTKDCSSKPYGYDWIGQHT